MDLVPGPSDRPNPMAQTRRYFQPHTRMSWEKKEREYQKGNAKEKKSAAGLAHAGGWRFFCLWPCRCLCSPYRPGAARREKCMDTKLVSMGTCSPMSPHRSPRYFLAASTCTSDGPAVCNPCRWAF